MYTVYADSNCIYNPLISDLAIFNTKLDLELNKSGSFSFSIPPSNPFINSIVKLKSVITVYEDNFIIFRGRALNDQEKFNKTVTVTCEGELAFLNDSVQRPFKFTGTPAELFTYLINKHNEQVDGFKQFKVGQVTVTDPNNYINRSDTEYSKTLDLLKEQLLETLGGYIWFRHESDGIYIDYLKDFTTLNRQPIKFGSNLLDLTKNEKADDIATVVIPLGALIDDENSENKGERLTIKSVNNGLDYIEDTEAITLRGRIVKVIQYDDVTNPTNLLRKGQEVLAQNVLLTNSIELGAVDLSSLNKEFTNFKLGSYVLIESSPHDLDTTMLVSKLSINLQKPASNKLLLGTSSTSFADKQHSINNKYDNVVENVWQITNNLKDNYNSKFEDSNNSIIQLRQDMLSAIGQEKDRIITTVAETYYAKGDVDTLISELNTVFTQTKDNFEMQFNKFTRDLEDINNDVNVNFETYKKYIRFEDGNIILGEVGNELTLKIEKDKVGFYQNNNMIGYYGNSKFYIIDGEVTHSLRIGGFAFVPRANGSLDFKKVGI